MNERASEFNPSRFELARKRRGLTKSALARTSGLSIRSITAFERAEREPPVATLEHLAQVLRFPIAWFTNPVDLEEPPLEGSSFRAISTLTATLRDQALVTGSIAFDLSDWIERQFSLPEPDVPRYEGVDPETAADAVRVVWGIGVRPIRNMVHLLEAHGVRVFSLAQDTLDVDAYSVWRVDQPYVFLNTMKTGERSRMDAAHELGHLVLHWKGGAQGREEEKEAALFGSAFLMPTRSLLASAPRGGRLDQILDTKRTWGVAATALVYRMHEVGLLKDWQYRSLFIELSRLGYRSTEPNGIQSEMSQVLGKVFQRAREIGLTTQQIADELTITVEELSSLVFGLVLTSLPSGRTSGSL